MLDDSKKRILSKILGCYEITRQMPPDVPELANKTEEDLDRIYMECFKKARNKIGIPKF